MTSTKTFVLIWLHSLAAIGIFWVSYIYIFITVYLGNNIDELLFDGPNELPWVLSVSVDFFGIRDNGDVFAAILIGGLIGSMISGAHQLLRGKPERGYLDRRNVEPEDRYYLIGILTIASVVVISFIVILAVQVVLQTPDNRKFIGFAVAGVTLSYFYCLYLWVRKVYFSKPPSNPTNHMTDLKEEL